MLPRWILLLGLAGLPGLLSAATFTVRNTNDSGPDSLRQAIFDANATPGLDSIHFAIGSGPRTISPLSALPTITDPVVLAGDTQPGYAGQPVIELSGAAAGPGVNGLHITSGGSAVRSLAINRFQSAFLGSGGNGIVLEGNGGNFIEGCFIGTDLSGMAALGNTAAGVLILNSPDNSVGAQVGGLVNVISGNGEGVRISGSDSDRNAIGENRIGTDWNATVPLGNAADGIVVAAGSGNIIGSAGGGGAISANGRSGVSIAGAASGTVVLGTRIGGALPSLANASHGIEVSADNNTIGGVLPGEGNVILGNGANGVLLISGASGNVVLGNLIGTDRFGFPTVGNAFNGVIASGANNNTIGGAAAGAGNVICANGTNGVRLRSGASGNLVAGNFIGIAPDGSTLGSNLSPLGNREEGVEINDGGAGNTVGPGNVISNNVGHGVLITDATVTGNVVDGNLIGTSPSGAAPAGNGADGVRVANSASGNRIGLSAGNTIAFNTGDGVFIESGTGNAIARNSLFDNGGLGIDLAPDGVNGNDAGDADTGPNGLQNFPVLTSVRSPGGTTVAEGSLGSAPSASYTLEFFSSSACDPSGQGEGQTFSAPPP